MKAIYNNGTLQAYKTDQGELELVIVLSGGGTPPAKKTLSKQESFKFCNDVLDAMRKEAK